jgi:hypothetical protein
MPGPTTADVALAWIKEAMAAGHYWALPHFDKRCRERSFTIFDAKRLIATATACEPYAAQRSFRGGTAWRLTGMDTDEGWAILGVEAYASLGRRILLVTIMDGRS